MLREHPLHQNGLSPFDLLYGKLFLLNLYLLIQTPPLVRTYNCWEMGFWARPVRSYLGFTNSLSCQWDLGCGSGESKPGIGMCAFSHCSFPTVDVM
ncbi:hypothetical protein STEG23_002198 [Scotinomys teguina]